MPIPKCYVCGSEEVESALFFDIYCSGTTTTECKCQRCGAEWFDDTISPDNKE